MKSDLLEPSEEENVKLYLARAERLSEVQSALAIVVAMTIKVK